MVNLFTLQTKYHIFSIKEGYEKLSPLSNSVARGVKNRRENY